jgi:acyl-CoA hydrolase
MQPSSDFDFRAIVRAGDHIAWPQAVGEPTGLTDRLARQGDDLPRATIVVGMVTTPTLTTIGPRFDFLCLNGGANARIAAARSGNRVIPAHVSAIPGLIRDGRIPVDIALVRVRPTERADVYSLGVICDFVHEMIEAARVVVAEIDERMPLTRQDSLVARDQLTHIVLADGREPIVTDPTPSERDVAVARRVAALIPDKATVQFGVGGLPVAVCGALSSHSNLGLHSGVIPDAAVALIDSGVVTNRYKGIDEGVSVTGGLFGTRRLFDFAHENKAIALRRATHTHAAKTLAQINMLFTINSAVAIDLTGQVNSEVAGGRYVGAVGGQIDFVRGARFSANGRSIIALTSTTPDGKHSKIVASLGGAPVTTARSDVDLVVTEHGVADLWGLDLRARTKALIAIADPTFRDDLAGAVDAACGVRPPSARMEMA